MVQHRGDEREPAIDIFLLFVSLGVGDGDVGRYVRPSSMFFLSITYLMIR
jgi:hypothetical protein